MLDFKLLVIFGECLVSIADLIYFSLIVINWEVKILFKSIAYLNILFSCSLCKTLRYISNGFSIFFLLDLRVLYRF